MSIVLLQFYYKIISNISKLRQSDIFIYIYYYLYVNNLHYITEIVTKFKNIYRFFRGSAEKEYVY